MTKNTLPIILWNKCSDKKQQTLLQRPITNKINNIYQTVNNILDQVQQKGDYALQMLTLKFDKLKINQLNISNSNIVHAKNKLSSETKNAIKIAKNNITRFHIAQKTKKIKIETFPGVICRQITKPLTSVGLYIPGKSAPLVSTVLMLGVPATIANCKRIILCSPPPISDEILYAAKLCNIQEIYQIGGAQAIAAMGFGTESIKKVDKIFGPGNIWVTEAKRQISQKLYGPSIDMLAGPSEILIIADNTANPKFIAADLLSQAEHGANSQVILLTPTIEIAHEVKNEISNQLIYLSNAKTINKSLYYSRIIITNNLKECINISNYYGPEHLSIQTKNPQYLLKQITNAGSIFIGDWSPEAAGDYASGTNHILPTYGYTKTHSSLGVIDFQKRITIQKISKNGLLNLAPIIETLAQIEGLTGHKNAITLRINTIREKNEHLSFSQK